jgi:hypothetical protein
MQRTIRNSFTQPNPEATAPVPMSGGQAARAEGDLQSSPAQAQESDAEPTRETDEQRTRNQDARHAENQTQAGKQRLPLLRQPGQRELTPNRASSASISSSSTATTSSVVSESETASENTDPQTASQQNPSPISKKRAGNPLQQIASRLFRGNTQKLDDRTPSAQMLGAQPSDDPVPSNQSLNEDPDFSMGQFTGPSLNEDKTQMTIGGETYDLTSQGGVMEAMQALQQIQSEQQLEMGLFSSDMNFLKECLANIARTAQAL